MANWFGTNNTNTLRRSAAIAADYKSLQGLGGIAIGAGLVLVALGWPAFGVLVMVAGGLASDAYYRRRFGRVRGRVDPLPTIVLVALALVLFPLGYRIDKAFGAPLLLFPLCAALFAVVNGRFAYRHIGWTRAHVVVVILVAACSLLPLLGVPLSSGPTAGVLVLAGAMVAFGVIDHLRLVAAMKPVPDE